MPSGVGPGAQSVVVTTPTGSSAPFPVTVESVKPGLLAPSSFLIGATQNLVALFPDNVTYVLPPGAIAGVPVHGPANPQGYLAVLPEQFLAVA